MITSYQNKRQARGSFLLCHFLCITILLSSLFTFFCYVDGFTCFEHRSDQILPHSNIIIGLDHYSYHNEERLAARSGAASQLFVGHYRRVPLRSPAVPILYFNGILFFLALLHRHKKQRKRFFPNRADNLYMIRYIHDQNGETYHSFPF